MRFRARTEMKFDVVPLVRISWLCWVFIEHDDDLCHVVEFRDARYVVESTLPLGVIGVAQASISNEGQKRMNMTFGGKVQACSHMTT